MNGQLDTGLKCLNAKTGGRAKAISKEIRCDHSWDANFGRDVLKNINREKFTQVKEAREELRKAWENNLTLVEAIGDPKEKYWSSGLSKEETEFTKEENWPGANNMGQILMELAVEFWGPPPRVPPAKSEIAHNSAESTGDDTQEPPAPIAFVNPEPEIEDGEIHENTENISAGANSMEVPQPKVNSVSESVNENECDSVAAKVAQGVKEAREKLAIFAHRSAKNADPGAGKSQNRASRPTQKERSKSRGTSPRTPSVKRQGSPSSADSSKVKQAKPNVNSNSSVKQDSKKKKFGTGATNAKKS